MRYLSLLFVSALGLSAQPVILPNGTVRPVPETPAPETRPEDLGSIEGQVLNAATGEPLTKATLMLNRAEMQSASVPPVSYTTSTDASGKFQLKDVEPGRYRLRAARSGYVGSEYGSRGFYKPGTTITLDRAKNLKDLVIRLSPHGVITGRVLDEDGDPVPYAQLALNRTTYNQGKKQLAYANSASTNDLGDYRMFGVAPGKYLLSVTFRQQQMMMPNSVNQTSQPDEDYVPTYYPGTLNPDSAAHLEIAAGATLSSINIKLSKARTVRIKGKVTQSLSPGRPVISVYVMPRTTDSMMMMVMNRSRMVDPKGNFEITGIMPGSYYVRANMNVNGKGYSGSATVDVGNRNIENLNVAIGPGITVTGNLKVEGNSKEALPNLQLRLMPREQGAMMMGMSLGRLADDGSFRIEDVAPDVYNLSIFGMPEGYYLKSVRSSETDVLATGLDMNGPAAPLQVVISPNGGQLSGSVRNPANQQPATGATVVLIPQDKNLRAIFASYKMSTTDQTGNFSFKGLTPGEYKVFAWEDIEPGAYADPEFVKPVESKGEAVTIKEGSAGSVQVTLIPAEESAPKPQQ